VVEQIADVKRQQKRKRLGLPVEEAPRPNITYGALCDELLNGYTGRDQSKRTLRYNLRYSRDRFERVPIRGITFEHVRTWFARLTVATTTKRNALGAARQAFNFAIEADYAHDNPFRKIDKPQATEAKHPLESWEEVFAVADALPRLEERAAVLFACATGLRPQEWRALEWRDIDRSAGVLRVNRTLQNGKVAEANAKTPGALRAVELFDVALEALDLLPTPIKRDTLVIPGRRGGVLDLHAWSRQGDRPGPWTSALARAGLAYREPRQMRHTFATLTLADGASIEWVSKQMGHKDIATTLRHYHKWLPSDRRNVSILNAARAGKSGPKVDTPLREASES
jgi:integrase